MQQIVEKGFCCVFCHEKNRCVLISNLSTFNKFPSYKSFLMALAQEKKYERTFYKWLCGNPNYRDDIIIFNWTGREERKWNTDKPYVSKFNCQIDVARAYRIDDRTISPILVGYELKGTETRIKKNKEGKETITYHSPPIPDGLGQAHCYRSLDADYVYIVRPKPQDPVKERELKRLIEMEPCYGLIYVYQINGGVEFRYIIEPSGRNLFVNLDRKKMNLAMATIFPKGHGPIQRQMWAREADFSDSSKI